jgi:hypothetical protein
MIGEIKARVKASANDIIEIA